MKDEKSTAFVTIVYGKYTRYIPAYVYSIFKMSPGSAIKIFTDKPVERGILQQVKLCRLHGAQVDIDSTTLESFSWLNEVAPDGIRAARWLLPEAAYPQKRYALISDVDIFFLPEDPALTQFHRARMKRTCLPFSNIVRKGGKRFTGIHFIEKSPYFFMVREKIKDMNATTARTLFEGMTKEGDLDEVFLCNLLTWAYHEAYDVDIRQFMKGEKKRPWHGLHLGAARRREPREGEFESYVMMTKDQAGAHLIDFAHDKLFHQLKIKKTIEFQRYAEFLGVNGWLK